MRAVVVSHGEVDPSDVAHVRGADLIVAADGGSEHLRAWGIAPHVVIGDLDSLDAPAASGARIERYPRDKDKTDTELALERAVAAGADEIVLVGALGGPRVDHALANALLLVAAHPARVRVVRGPLSLRVLRGGERMAIEAKEGEIVTLLPFGGDAHGVRTEGLRYPLHGETLRFGSSRGVSNEVSGKGAAVSLGAGVLVVIEGGAIAPRSGQQAQA